MRICKPFAMIAFLAGLLLFPTLSPLWAAGPPKALKKEKVIMVGDRLVDVATRLGVAPEGMVIRLSLWPRGEQLALVSQALGCPNKVTNKAPGTLSAFMKKTGITRVLVEKYSPTCLYMKINLNKIPELVRDVPGASVEFVDFDKGLVGAIEDLAAKFNKIELGKELAAAYTKNLKQAEDALPKQGLGKRVVVLNGTYIVSVGKTFINVEAPGGYTDKFILSRLGCSNAAAPMISNPSMVSKGHASCPRLAGLKEAKPDVIVMVGDAFAVQKALHEALLRDPDLGNIPAIKNAAVYNLPFYADAGLLEYPDVLRQWTHALKN